MEMRVNGKRVAAVGPTFKVGETIGLELWLRPGDESAPIAQQTYLNFSREYLQAALPTGDASVFDLTLLAEACNEGACRNGTTQTPPGTISFASGTMTNPPPGDSTAFKVGEIKLKATAPGRARLQWQIGGEGARNTGIASEHGVLSLDPRLFKNIFINIVK